MRTMKKVLAILFGALILTCTISCKNQDSSKAKEPYVKKYTNDDFYKNGELDPQIALAAYLDMLEHYGVPYSDFLKENLWITDFSLGDFENVGMAGIFWVNDQEHKYLGHEIYLLPGQMIVEHRHIATEYPAKFESWQVRHGWVYNYSIGHATPNPPQLPESQKDFITVNHFRKQIVDEVIHLAEIESPHFLLAGPNGSIVTEYASYHDGNGLRFTNPNVEFVDALSKIE